MNDIRLGEILAEAGTITRRQLEQALAYQKEHGGLRIGQALTALGFATQRQVLQALARRLDLPLADLSQQPAEREALELVPQALAVRYHVLAAALPRRRAEPCGRRPAQLLRVRGPAPADRARAGYPAGRTGAAFESRTILLCRSGGPARLCAQPMCSRGGGAVPPPGPAAVDVRAAEDGAPAVRLLNNLLQRAITAGASDIHIETV